MVNELTLSNDPVPDVVQVPPVATITVPVKEIEASAAQTDWSIPALTCTPGK